MNLFIKLTGLKPTGILKNSYSKTFSLFFPTSHTRTEIDIYVCWGERVGERRERETDREEREY
jgi:hypothetical protein